MQNMLSNSDLISCPKCGGGLQQGFILGKHNRIRWSTSPKGMTIFHGVPLIKLEKGFWRKCNWWAYAPSITAKRCQECKIVIFQYNNEQKENPKNERVASLLIGGVIIVAAIAGLLMTYFGWSLNLNIPFYFYLVLGSFSLIIFAIGVMFLTRTKQSH
jgi:uncharacterized protein DUF6487